MKYKSLDNDSFMSYSTLQSNDYTKYSCIYLGMIHLVRTQNFKLKQHLKLNSCSNRETISDLPNLRF